MHITPTAITDQSGSAAATAASEAETWRRIARDWDPADHADAWAELPGSEAAVVGFFDPTSDLDRRGAAWGYGFGRYDLADVARFAAALARAEAEAWEQDRPHVATKAFEDRRFLISDRIVHWAVPWLDSVAGRGGASAAAASATRNALLELGDRLRPAPALTGSEGLVVPGFDSFGPIESGAGLAKTLPSLWSGAILTRDQISAVRHAKVTSRVVAVDWLKSEDTRRGFAAIYGAAARKWDRLAATHPGTAQLWRDLAHRAERTERTLA